MVDLDEKDKFFKIVCGQGQLDFTQLFGSEKPITMEIGTGKGEFIATYSRFYPERNFVGVELKSKRVITILKKLDIQKNFNVRLLNVFIDEHITELIPPCSIDEMIVFHPDPWPKKRHHKRRLFQNRFIDSIVKILKDSGFIRISTDDPNYAEWINDLFEQREDFVSMYQGGMSKIPPEDHIVTYFDAKHAVQGYEPIFLTYKKAVQ